MANYPTYDPNPYPQSPYQPQACGQAYAPPMYRQGYGVPYAPGPQPVPVMQPVPQVQQAQPTGLQVIPAMVTCREEAVATPVDFSAQKIYVFIDPAHQRIYTKQFDSGSGAAPIREYALAAPAQQAPAVAPAKEPAPQEYVTVETFREAMDAVGAAIDELQSARAAVEYVPDEAPEAPPVTVRKPAQRRENHAQ